MLECTRRGVFAVGDVRRGSTKRVAAAVGDGALVVRSIHASLAARRKQHMLHARETRLIFIQRATPSLDVRPLDT